MAKASSVVFAGNATDIMVPHDHADSSSLFLQHVDSVEIFTIPFNSRYFFSWCLYAK